MGEPAKRSAKERAETRDLATAIVEAVRNDERMPHGLEAEGAGRHRVFDADDVEALLMRMAQEIAALEAERDTVWSRLDNWDWRGLLRDARRGDFTSVVDALRDAVAMDESREEALTAEIDEGTP